MPLSCEGRRPNRWAHRPGQKRNTFLWHRQYLNALLLQLTLTGTSGRSEARLCPWWDWGGRGRQALLHYSDQVYTRSLSRAKCVAFLAEPVQG